MLYIEDVTQAISTTKQGVLIEDSTINIWYLQLKRKLIFSMLKTHP